MRIARTGTGVVAVLITTFALAAPPASAGESDIVTEPTRTVAVSEAPECIDAIAATEAAGLEVAKIDCTLTTVATTSAGKVATATDIASDDTLSAADRKEIAQAALRATIYSKHYSWATTGGSYTVTHNGTFYYDGSRAWVGVSYQGYTGSHNCFLNYSVGLTITNEACTESGGTSSRTLYYQWRVTWPFNVPPSYSVSNTGYVYANGTTS